MAKLFILKTTKIQYVFMNQDNFCHNQVKRNNKLAKYEVNVFTAEQHKMPKSQQP